ncbi:MAG: HAMP domain-containing protein [Anaerolineales bacterium]|nr:HAMP domain-containing protein [Anaerolineales bacterium]
MTGYSFLLALIFGFIIFYFTRSITTPLQKLTRVAEEISNGNLQVTAPVESLDEVGTLAETINRMTEQLQDTYNNLERRITERTVDLEISAVKQKHALPNCSISARSQNNQQRAGIGNSPPTDYPAGQ